MTEEVITKTVPGKLGTVLTEHEYETLDKMLCSKDEGDHRMAQAILNQCDVKASIYWIWKLARKNASKMVYLRTKASRVFQVEAELFSIAYKKATAFALAMHAKQWLTPEIYVRIKPEILDELVARNKESNLYNIHVTIKYPFLDYDQEDKLLQLTHL